MSETLTQRTNVSRVSLSREPKSMILCESLTQRMNMSRVSLSREPKSMILCESLTQRMNMSRVSLILIITIILTFHNSAIYAKAEMENKQATEFESNVNKEIVEPEILEFFTVDDNVYKVIADEKDENIVIFWNCKKLDDSKNIVINNNVKYNGYNYKVRFVYEKAFSNSIQFEKIIIGNEILGFCDLSGNLVQMLNGVFKDQGVLKSVDFGNINAILGEKCFENCKNIMDVKMSDNINKMKGNCFVKCYSLKNIDLSEIKEIKGQSNFANCSKLESIGQINNEITELPDKTFMSCGNLKINNLNNVTKLGNEVFEYCRVLNQDIVTNVEEIGDKCFFGCNFEEVYLKKAEKIGDRAFGKIVNLKKIRFGSPSIPFFQENIAEGSSVNQWVYPLNYKYQTGYSKFLRKLLVSKVIWCNNYEKLKQEETQSVSLNSLNPPDFSREGYEIEGWYKEPECINKVNMIADLGEIIDSDIVIKDPVLYAKWIAKETSTIKEPNKPEEPKEADTTKESPELEEPSTIEDPSKSEEPNTTKEVTKPEDTKDTSTPKDSSEQSEEIIPNESSGSKDNYDKNAESENKKNTRSAHKTRKNKKDGNDLLIKKQRENKEVVIEENNMLFLENGVINNGFVSSIQSKNVEIKDLNLSYIYKTNNNIEIMNKGIININKVTKNNKWIKIYLKSNDYFKNNATKKININLKNFIN